MAAGYNNKYRTPDLTLRMFVRTVTLVASGHLYIPTVIPPSYPQKHSPLSLSLNDPVPKLPGLCGPLVGQRLCVSPHPRLQPFSHNWLLWHSRCRSALASEFVTSCQDSQFVTFHQISDSESTNNSLTPASSLTTSH